LCVTAENSGGGIENSSPENEPEEENNNNLSNSDSKNIFDEKNVKRALEIKNKDAYKRAKDDMLFAVKYHEWLGKDIWENN